MALEEDDPELFLLALRNVTEAQGGVARLAEKTKLNRESLYRMLSERGNPEFKSLDVTERTGCAAHDGYAQNKAQPQFTHPHLHRDREFSQSKIILL